MIETVHAMDQEKRWRLGLDLYHAVPIPAWFRRLITWFRRGMGIR